MKFPSEYTKHFSISNSDNGFILYYEEEIFDLDAENKITIITKSRVYGQTIEGQKNLIEDIIELIGWYPSKRKDGLIVEVYKQDMS